MEHKHSFRIHLRTHTHTGCKAPWGGEGGCQPACIRSCHGHIGGLQVGEDGAQESPPPPWTEKKKMLVLACRLAFASFACGRPPPLEASHSLSSKANLRRQWQFFFFFFLDGRKAPFPCMRWYNTLELVVHRCLASVTASFFNTAGRLSLIPSLSLSPFSPYGSGCSFNRGFWRLFITAGGPNWHKVVVVVKFSVFLFTVKITH